MKQSPAAIRREINRLCNYIDSNGGSIEARVAYEVEHALRWATEDTVKWPKPLEGALETAAIIRKEKSNG